MSGQITFVAPCDGWLAEYTNRDGGQPMRERVAAFGILRQRVDGVFFDEAIALVNEGTGGLIPAADAENFVRIVHRDDLVDEARGNEVGSLVRNPSIPTTD